MAVVGRIARTHGLRGQLIVNPETDFPEERFQAGSELFALQADGGVQLMTVVSCRLQQGRPVIGIDGIDDIDAAARLAGVELRVPVERLAPLPAGTFYRHELVGCTVSTDDGLVVGEVTEVQGTAAESRLVVQGAGGEVLVPLAEAICTTIDPQARRIVVTPPAGLLELNVTGQSRRPSGR